jgi:hypothetical protein
MRIALRHPCRIVAVFPVIFNPAIAFSAAEQVLVMPANGMPDAVRLHQRGVSDAARCPFDCLAEFDVARVTR